MNVTEALKIHWHSVEVPVTIPHGDMPGDKICIDGEHVRKADAIMPVLQEQLIAALNGNAAQRAVVCVCGGSGVGKSEIASVLAYDLHLLGVNSYVMSGDNYPHRIPRDNDAQRLRIYRMGGMRGFAESGCYDRARADELRSMWAADADTDPAQAGAHPFMRIYQQSGRRCLKNYLGTPSEIDFNQVNGIIARFKQGADKLLLKRMGREDTELWYDTVNVQDTQVLIIEWTHGNSDYIEGVDIPILLNSTPAQTLAHRRARNRDGKTDSAFTTMVLELEQQKLESQAHKAKIILSKGGEALDYSAYRRLMAQA